MLPGSLLGQELTVEVVVLHIQVSSTSKAGVTAEDDIRGKAAESLSHVLVFEGVVEVIISQAILGELLEDNAPIPGSY